MYTYTYIFNNSLNILNLLVPFHSFQRLKSSKFKNELKFSMILLYYLYMYLFSLNYNSHSSGPAS